MNLGGEGGGDPGVAFDGLRDPENDRVERRGREEYSWDEVAIREEGKGKREREKVDVREEERERRPV